METGYAILTKNESVDLRVIAEDIKEATSIRMKDLKLNLHN